jgi:prophage regulatory protein
MTYIRQQHFFPETGFLRLSQVLQFIPVSKSTWWAGVKSGRFPQPVRTLGVRITAWRVEDIRQLLGDLSHGGDL